MFLLADDLHVVRATRFHRCERDQPSAVFSEYRSDNCDQRKFTVNFSLGQMPNPKFLRLASLCRIMLSLDERGQFYLRMSSGINQAHEKLPSIST
jgi:hypothetical protein